MNKTILRYFIMLMIISLFIGCNVAPPKQVAVGFVAKAINGATSALSMRSITMSDTLTVDQYEVVFYKIEIGNSEDDKFTIWENSAGSTKDLVTAVDFTETQTAEAGSYDFCRITIGTTISLTGTSESDTGTATVTVTGTETDLNTADQQVFLFGVSGTATGEFLLNAPITIEEGSVINLTFDLNGTVSDSLAGAGVNISLSPPALDFYASAQ